MYDDDNWISNLVEIKSTSDYPLILVMKNILEISHINDRSIVELEFMTLMLTDNKVEIENKSDTLSVDEL